MDLFEIWPSLLPTMSTRDQPSLRVTVKSEVRAYSSPERTLMAETSPAKLPQSSAAAAIEANVAIRAEAVRNCIVSEGVLVGVMV